MAQQDLGDLVKKRSKIFLTRFSNNRAPFFKILHTVKTVFTSKAFINNGSQSQTNYLWEISTTAQRAHYLHSSVRSAHFAECKLYHQSSDFSLFLKRQASCAHPLVYSIAPATHEDTEQENAQLGS